MTRDEAIRLAHKAMQPHIVGVVDHAPAVVASLEALGLLKLDEPPVDAGAALALALGRAANTGSKMLTAARVMGFLNEEGFVIVDSRGVHGLVMDVAEAQR